MLAFHIVLTAFCCPVLTKAAYDIEYGSDDDLSRYVTRPEIRAPLFEIIEHEPEKVTPGYWFVAPYAHIIQEKHAAKYYQPCQTGPAIYDSTGELIWSGACLSGNQNTCDFRAFIANGSTHMSAIFSYYAHKDHIGRGVIFDNSMQIIQEVRPPNTMGPFNMHEFLVLNDGKTAMHIVQRIELADVAHLGLEKFEGMTAGLVANMGIHEVDLNSGKTLFLWWASDHINLNASTFEARNLNGPYPNGWDWMYAALAEAHPVLTADDLSHLNAIDKNSEGDYLVTARYTDAVYKVSGRDGHVMWSLGGTTSSFHLDGFNFSRPHDARFVSSDSTSETITLLDNGGCEESKSSDISSALIIYLDKSSEPWVAVVKTRWTRPDNGRSDKRGNFQLLPNGNAFIGWSENSYISEHSLNGDVLMEAQFTSERFVTYRAYKFNFTSSPAEPPVLKGFAYGESPEKSVSVYYVSWNGATEVSHWEFYTKDNDFLGRVSRSGFETTFQQSSHYADQVYAQAVSANNHVLGKTEIEEIRNPSGWTADNYLIESILQAAKEDSSKSEL